MVEAAPATAFIVTEADLLLEFEMSRSIPTELGLVDYAFERDIGRRLSQ
jgi:hypothetical protein